MDNIGNDIFEGFNDKQGLMICGYEWGYSKEDKALEDSDEKLFYEENAETIFSNKSPMHGDRAFKWKYDNNIIKWFELWGHPLSREELGGGFEKSIIQTNWCNTEGNKIEENYYQKLTDPEQLNNFIYHIDKFEPALILFMGTQIINVLQDDAVMAKFSKIMGLPITEPQIIQKNSSGTRFKIAFQNFEKCKVVCLPHASGAQGLSDEYISNFGKEIGKLITEFKQLKGIS